MLRLPLHVFSPSDLAPCNKNLSCLSQNGKQKSLLEMMMTPHQLNPLRLETCQLLQAVITKTSDRARGNVSSCAQEDSFWTSGRIPSLKWLSSIETGYAGMWWSYHSWKGSGNDWAWHSVLLFSDKVVFTQRLDSTLMIS